MLYPSSAAQATKKAHGRKGGKFRDVKPLARIVLVAGFEAFNLQLYNQVVSLRSRGGEGGVE